MEGEFNPEVCPIGITNEKSIENLGDRVDMAIERLTEKVSEVKDDITSLSKFVDEKFESMDEKFDNVDKRFDSMEDKFYDKIGELKKSIPDIVDDRLERKKGNMASNVIRWVLCGVFGGIIISIATSWVKMKLGL